MFCRNRHMFEFENPFHLHDVLTRFGRFGTKLNNFEF